MTAPTMHATRTTPTWPRPRLVHDRAALFREPAYEDGQPYADDSFEDDTDT